VTICWQGGFASQHEIKRPLREYTDLRDYNRLVERVTSLREKGTFLRDIARILNEEGFQRPWCKRPFSKAAVRDLLSRRGIGQDKRVITQLGENEWWPKDLAKAVGVPVWKMEFWADKCWVHCRQTPIRKWSILWADAEEVERLKKLRARSRHGCHKHPEELTTPKERKEP